MAEMEMHAWVERTLERSFKTAEKVCSSQIYGWDQMQAVDRAPLLVEVVKSVATLIAAYDG